MTTTTTTTTTATTTTSTMHKEPPDKTVRDLTAAMFVETIRRDGIVLVDFWASWCGPCLAFAPIFEAAAAADKHRDVVFAKVDTEKEHDIASAFGIRAIPTLGVFRDGVLLALQPGALPRAALDELILRVRALDMNEINTNGADSDSNAARKEGA
jgi:thioredoxin 1